MAICDKTDGIAVISDLVSPVQNPKNTENRLYLLYKLHFQKYLICDASGYLPSIKLFWKSPITIKILPHGREEISFLFWLIRCVAFHG